MICGSAVHRKRLAAMTPSSSTPSRQSHERLLTSFPASCSGEVAAALLPRSPQHTKGRRAWRLPAETETGIERLENTQTGALQGNAMLPACDRFHISPDSRAKGSSPNQHPRPSKRCKPLVQRIPGIAVLTQNPIRASADELDSVSLAQNTFMPQMRLWHGAIGHRSIEFVPLRSETQWEQFAELRT